MTHASTKTTKPRKLTMHIIAEQLIPEQIKFSVFINYLQTGWKSPVLRFLQRKWLLGRVPESTAFERFPKPPNPDPRQPAVTSKGNITNDRISQSWLKSTPGFADACKYEEIIPVEEETKNPLLSLTFSPITAATSVTASCTVASPLNLSCSSLIFTAWPNKQSSLMFQILILNLPQFTVNYSQLLHEHPLMPHKP